ncbi:uncharacterized protein TNCV_1244391 [Trichonephila clavipes]|nr:uncharacterized protein TNCV_1244391 [Trichonephila clavipes]
MTSRYPLTDELPWNRTCNLTIDAVEPHLLSQCRDPADDIDAVFFHPELPVHVNKQTDLPAYLKQLAIERTRDIRIDAVQVYTDGSRDDYYRSASLACSHPRMPRAHQAQFSRRSLTGVGFYESVRSHGPGLALLTNGGVQQQQQE